MSIQRNTPANQGPVSGGPMVQRPTSRGSGRGGPMGHGPMAMMKGEKARDFKGTMVTLIQYLGSYKISILIVMFFAIGSTIFMIASPKILGQATTRLFEGVMGQITGTGTGIDFQFIGRIIVINLGL